MTTKLLKQKKSKLIVVAPKSLLRKVGDLLTTVNGGSFKSASEVCNLDVMFDPTYSFQSQINGP